MKSFFVSIALFSCACISSSPLEAKSGCKTTFSLEAENGKNKVSYDPYVHEPIRVPENVKWACGVETIGFAEQSNIHIKNEYQARRFMVGGFSCDHTIPTTKYPSDEKVIIMAVCDTMTNDHQERRGTVFNTATPEEVTMISSCTTVCN